MTRGWRACAVALAAAGCDQVFSVDHIEGPDAPAGVALCTADDFSADTLDPLVWTVLGGGTGSVTMTDGGDLRIDVPEQTTSDQDPNGGIRSLPFDLTGGSAEIQVRETAPATVRGGAYLKLEADSTHYYELLVQQGKAVARSYLDAMKIDIPEIYNPAVHDVLRLRHDAATNEIVWESHGDGSDWHELRRETFAFPPSVLTVSAYAASFDVTPAYTVRYDNFVVFGRCGR